MPADVDGSTTRLALLPTLLAMLGVVQPACADYPGPKNGIVDGDSVQTFTRTNPGLTAPGYRTPQPLVATQLGASGVAVTVLGSGAHLKGGWVQNCNVSGAMVVNDNGSASLTVSGSNASLVAGVSGFGQVYLIPAGTTLISVIGSVSGMVVCGEGYN